MWQRLLKAVRSCLGNPQCCTMALSSKSILLWFSARQEFSSLGESWYLECATAIVGDGMKMFHYNFNTPQEPKILLTGQQYLFIAWGLQYTFVARALVLSDGLGGTQMTFLKRNKSYVFAVSISWSS